MSLTYREAWNLFQYEHSSPSSFNENPQVQDSVLSDNRFHAPANATDTSNREPTSPSSDLVAELRRLREDLQRLQFAGVQDQSIDVALSTSDPPNLSSPASQTDTATRANQAPPRSDSLCCWEPCCNGRAFSNRSNLVRHQRERRGESAKLRCSFCDAVFSRRAARDMHEAARRCRR